MYGYFKDKIYRKYTNKRDQKIITQILNELLDINNIYKKPQETSLTCRMSFVYKLLIELPSILYENFIGFFMYTMTSFNMAMCSNFILFNTCKFCIMQQNCNRKYTNFYLELLQLFFTFLYIQLLVLDSKLGERGI